MKKVLILLLFISKLCLGQVDSINIQYMNPLALTSWRLGINDFEYSRVKLDTVLIQEKKELDYLIKQLFIRRGTLRSVDVRVVIIVYSTTGGIRKFGMSKFGVFINEEGERFKNRKLFGIIKTYWESKYRRW